ncbi:MAG: LysM peptidoglycan-binding domain-containing protein [Bacteroidetes bacterium]|nr:LysM peptidoglycan-binding domain-containing protein [Bacteroidota bacterium]
MLPAVLFALVPAANPVLAVQTQESGVLSRVNILPPDDLELEDGLLADYASPDSLTEAQLLARLARLYEFQAEVLTAMALGHEDDVSPLLEGALTDLSELLKHQYVREEPRFMEIYQVLVSEYERQFGISDTLFLAYGDIFDTRSDVFAALEKVRNPLLEDVFRPELQPLQTTVPMTMNRLVESTMQTLLKTPDRHLIHWLERADTYFPMIEQIFREEGIPDELKYLAMIESGLNPKARSWARAVGMWQFVAGTGRAYGLEINAWVDDRMDPEKSTRAAAKHLKDLYARYGDWHIAMAGYNCSPRCIRRAINRAKSDGHAVPTYWDMYRYLPRETRGYVPMYVATSFIISNPNAFDLKQVKPGPAYEYQLIPVQGMLSLREIADLAGTDLSTMRALNPSLRRSTLPPSTGLFYLKIPVGSTDQFYAAYDALPESVKQPAGEYVVRRGDTLGEIGTRYGVSVSRLMQKNGLRSTRIQIGQRLVVPLSDYSQTLPEIVGATGTLVQYGRRSTRPIISITQRRTSTAAGSSKIVQANAPASGPSQSSTSNVPNGQTRIVYTVRRGDTLGKIADRFKVSVSQLQSWNNLRGTRIISGARLSIYTDSGSASTSGQITYVVKSGDTLSKIATRHGVTVTNLRRWNGISGSRIRTGQRLNIRSGSGSEMVIHTVRRGDTLIGIASRYAVTVAKIKEWNTLRSNTIRVGQQLNIFR